MEEGRGEMTRLGLAGRPESRVRPRSKSKWKAKEGVKREAWREALHPEELSGGSAEVERLFG